MKTKNKKIKYKSISNKKKLEYGITLIALIITIIIMLILVTTTILLTLNSGLFEKAAKATKEWNEIDQNIVNESVNYIDIAVKQMSCVHYFANGKCQKCEFQVELGVARIGESYYKTLQEAIDAVPTGNTETTIELLENILENVSIAQNKNIKLNLNNKTIKNLSEAESIIILNGKLEINEGEIIGEYPENSVINSVIVKPNAELSVNKNTKLTSDSSRAVLISEENGKVTVVGGYIFSEKSNSIMNSGILEVYGTSEITSNVSGQNYPTIYNNSTGEILITQGARIIGNNTAITNHGSGTINNSTIISANGSGINNYGILNIGASTEISSNYVTIGNQSGGTLSIAGGKIFSPDNNSIVNNGELRISGSAEITSSSVDSNAPTVYNGTNGELIVSGNPKIIGNIDSSAIVNTCNVTITGGRISSQKRIAINNRNTGNMIITGGTISSEEHKAVKNYGTLEIGGTAEITNYATELSTVYNDATGILNITGGNISNTTGYYAVYNKEGTVTHTGGTISRKNF